MNPVPYAVVLLAASLSFLLEWLPGVSRRWAGLGHARKAALITIAVALTTFVSLAGSCLWLTGGCPAGSGLGRVGNGVLLFLVAYAVNQSLYRGLFRRELWGRGYSPRGRIVEY